MRESLGDQLPTFSEEDRKLLANSLDFIGLNHYTSRLISHVTECSDGGHFYRTQAVGINGNTGIVTWFS